MRLGFILSVSVILAIGCSPALEQPVTTNIDDNAVEVPENTKAPGVMLPDDAENKLRPYPNPPAAINLTAPASFRFGTAEPEIIDTRDFQPQMQIARAVPGDIPKSGSMFGPKKEGLVLSDAPLNDLVAGGVAAQERIEHQSLFPGISASPWTPPDPSIAVGPNHIIQTVNMELAFFTKSGDMTFQQTLDSTGNPGFFESVGAGDFCFDPKCYYDHYSNRFYVLALERYTNTGFITFAVSDDDDPNGIWYRYRTPALVEVGNGTYWVDYPGMGFDENGFYVTGNLFLLFGSGDGVAGTLFRSFDKTPLESGNTASFTDIRDGGIFSVQVAQTFGDNIAPMFAALQTFSQVRLIALRNALTNPSFETAIIDVPFGSSPPVVPNGAGGSLSSLVRMMNVQWRDGKLFTCNTVSSAGRAVARWYEFETNNWPDSGQPALVQSGDIDLGGGVHTFFPAIYSNADDSVAVVYAMSENGSFASVGASGRLACDAAGQMSTATEFEIGSATADGRWGDYFDVTVDPADDKTFWMVGEVQTANGWQTVINSFTIPAPFEIPSAFDLVRGTQLGGDLADALESDDQYMEFNPGFTLNSSEAPVWLTFDGNVSSDCNGLSIESNANTPGLSLTAEMFNWNTSSFDVVGTASASFNTDSVESFEIDADHVDGNGDVQTRIGWRQTGFTLLFPWLIRVDQVGWGI